MEAFGLLRHGFAVLLTWKILALMMVGLVLGIFVGVLPGHHQCKCFPRQQDGEAVHE